MGAVARVCKSHCENGAALGKDCGIDFRGSLTDNHCSETVLSPFFYDPACGEGGRAFVRYLTEIEGKPVDVVGAPAPARKAS